jgi:hypothetical protein
MSAIVDPWISISLVASLSDLTKQPRRLLSLAEVTIIQHQPNTLSVIVDRGRPMRLSFFAMPRQVPPYIALDSGLQVPSLPDLVGTQVNGQSSAAAIADVERARSGRLVMLTL